jgi:hypothetical protein
VEQASFLFTVMMSSSQLAFLFVILCASQSCEAWLFSSSESNREKAQENYPDSGLERWVATSFGDEIPKMRDDLIERKKNGEGPIRRHWNAWRTLENWEVDRNNDEKEANDPAADPQ